MQRDLSLNALRSAYQSGDLTPSALVRELHPHLEGAHGSFIALATLEDLLERCRVLEAESSSVRELPSLWGVPFAVKDNIDALPFPTTAACPAYEFQPACSAPAVEAILKEGAVLVGKTNMDQFAAGLVGTRTPYGVAKNAFDDRFIPGGSSSGSGALVGAGLLSFALGTDTAGSGRVPAMLNGCVGIKPTVGRVSSTGVVPACRSLDCISCFARNVEDGARVVHIMEGAGRLSDPCWRPPPPHLHLPAGVANGSSSPGAARSHATAESFTFAVPNPDLLEFEGPCGAAADDYRRAFREAVKRMESGGGELVEVDFSPFCEVASLLYNSAFVAERYAGIREFVDAPRSEEQMEAVTAAIISAGKRHSAADAFKAFADLADLSAKARVQMDKVDLLLVPTVLQHYLVAEIEAEEKPAGGLIGWSKNTLSGRFTNFVNLLDMAAVSIPSGLIHHPDLSSSPSERADVKERAAVLEKTGLSTPVLPFGVTLIGRAWTDEFLWEVAGNMQRRCGLGCGPRGHGVQPYQQPRAVAVPKSGVL